MMDLTKLPKGKPGLEYECCSLLIPHPEPDPDAEQFEGGSNYELSWLKFNWRVLHQATDSQNPLLERVQIYRNREKQSG